MEPSWLLLGIGKDGKQMQKSKRNDSYQSSWYKTRAVYAAMHSQTQKNARFTFLLSQVYVDGFSRFLRLFEGLLVQWSFQRLSRVFFKSHLGAKMELKSAFLGSP